MCIEHLSWQAINVHGHPNMSIVVIELGNCWPIAIIDRFDIKRLSLIDKYHDARSVEWFPIDNRRFIRIKIYEFQLNKHLMNHSASLIDRN